MSFTILVVDDDLSVLDVVSTALSEKQFNVIPAYNLEGALEELKTHNVDLMITDINMPGGSGFQLIEYARKIMKYRRLPIVVITAMSDKEVVEKAKGIGVEGFIAKPVDINKLYELIESVFRKITLERTGEARKQAASVDLKTLSVLVVDDEIPITELLAEYLEPQVRTVFKAHNFDQAVDVCQNNAIDLVISDIKMTDKSGFDLVEWINEYPGTAGIPVVLITGVKRDLNSVKTAKKLWIDKFIIKPFDLENIRQTIVEVCDNQRRKKKLQRFNDYFIELDEDAQREEQNQLQQIRTQILVLKKQVNLANKQLRLLSKDATPKERHDAEARVTDSETKAKDFQDRMSETKKEFYERKKQFVAVKRGIHQRLDQFR